MTATSQQPEKQTVPESPAKRPRCGLGAQAPRGAHLQGRDRAGDGAGGESPRHSRLSPNPKGPSLVRLEEASAALGGEGQLGRAQAALTPGAPLTPATPTPSADGHSLVRGGGPGPRNGPLPRLLPGKKVPRVCTKGRRASLPRRHAARNALDPGPEGQG